VLARLRLSDELREELTPAEEVAALERCGGVQARAWRELACGVPPSDPRWGKDDALEFGIIWHLGRAEEAMALAERALADARRYEWRNSLVAVLFTLTQIYIASGELRLALPHAAEAREVARTQEIPERTRTMVEMSYASVCMHLAGGQGEAVEVFRRDLENRGGTLDERLRLVVVNLLARTLWLLGRDAEAAALLEEGLTQVDGEEQPWVESLMSGTLGNLLLVQGRLAEARESFVRHRGERDHKQGLLHRRPERWRLADRHGPGVVPGHQRQRPRPRPRGLHRRKRPVVSWKSAAVGQDPDQGLQREQHEPEQNTGETDEAAGAE